MRNLPNILKIDPEILLTQFVYTALCCDWFDIEGD